MNSIEPRSRERQLLVGDLACELRQLAANVTDELEAFGVVGVGNVDRCEPRVLSNARMNLGDAFRDEDDDVVFLQQSRAGYPSLERYEVGPIVAGHIAHVAGWDDCIEEVDDHCDLIAVKKEVLDQGQRASRLPGKLTKRVAIHQRIGNAKQRSELTLGVRRTKLDSFAPVVREELFGADELALKIVEKAYVFRARSHEIINVVI